MESVHKMHNIKDERETVSALCHRGYLQQTFSHGVSTVNTTVCIRRHIINYKTVYDC